MALIKKPVTGMKDILPAEMEIRDYCISVIKKTYAEFGFQSIETPCVENIENLTSKQGGDNEKLIFKILKRGEKLKLESAKSEADLVDGGLRYDLTVPLVRYFANHQNELPMPFKALQMGNVWRADRPQKGRYRQFMQCDIDIIGEPSNLAEIELILATTTTLGNLGFKGFQIRINERRILKAMAAYSGFPEDRYTDVFIILDKMDKIGLDGAAKELIDEGFTEEMKDRYVALFKGLEAAEDQLGYLEQTLEGFIEPDVRHEDGGFRDRLRSYDRARHVLLHGDDLRDRHARTRHQLRRRRTLRRDGRQVHRQGRACMRLLDRVREDHPDHDGAGLADPGKARQEGLSH